MNIAKAKMAYVLKNMVIESFGIVKLHVEWIQENELDHPLTYPLTYQVGNQLAYHLKILHWSFPILKDLMNSKDLEKIGSKDLIEKIEIIYIEGMKKGHIPKCECDYCQSHINNKD